MQHALRLQPGNFLYWYNYGSLLATSQRLSEAKVVFERTLKLRPGFYPAQRDLAIVNQVLGK